MENRSAVVLPVEASLSRRTFLHLGNAALLASAFGGVAAGKAMKLREAKDAVDHLVLGVSDLRKGIEWFEAKTGVRPAFGGKHPNRGTQNALVSFGNRQYLELLAPDPEQAGHPRAADLLKLSEPRLVLWASATSSIDELAQQAKTAKLLAMGPIDGSRARPDGKLLKWRSLSVVREADKELIYFNIVPFFIQWDKDSLHPSVDSPMGCKLLSVDFEHPEADRITEVMKSLGLDSKISKSKSPAIKATLKTSNGNVVLK